MEGDNLREERARRDHISLEITQFEPVHDHENPMISSIKGKLEAISFPPCIFPVPAKILSQCEGAYHPKVVSIGPFHHGETHLKHMEHHKWEYLNALLGRNLNLNSALNSCTQALKEMEQKIRASYQEDFSLMRSEEFLTMILVDAGFIIELLLRYTIRGLRMRDDPLFKSPEKFHVLRSDLILLQNQIPFFVLRKIFSLVPLPKQCDRSVSELSLRFFRNLIPGDQQLLQEKYSFEGSSHLLDLIWKCYLPSTSKVPLSSGKNLGRDHLHSVSTLQEAGIKVIKSEAESILDVKFIDGKLVIPTMKIDNYMETLFRNMIAYEHCHGEKMKHVTSYAYLMKGLLHSNNDVKLFFRREILIDYIEKKEEIITLFKILCENVDLDKFYYEGMWEQLLGYRRTNQDALCYKIKRKHLRNQKQRLGSAIIISVIILILIGILFVIIYVFIIHHNHH